MLKQIACASALIAGASVAASAQTIAHGYWGGGPHHMSGRFSHCAAGAKYVSGITVYFAIHANWSLTVAFTHPDFNLTEGTTYNIVLHLDALPPRPLTVTAIAPKSFAAHFPLSRAIYEQFRSGRVFHLAGDKSSISFNLDGTSVALEQIARCVQANVGGANPYIPPSPPPAVAATPPAVAAAPAPISTAPPVSAANREKLITLVANMFIEAGVTGMQMLPLEETPPGLKHYDLVWKGPNLLGAGKFYRPAAGLSAKAITDEIVANDAKACPGKFLSGVRPDEAQDTIRFRRVFIKCEDFLGTTTNMNYVVFGAADRGYYIIAHVSREAGGKLDDVDDSIARIAVRQVRQ